MALLREDPKANSKADVRRADGGLSIIASGTIVSGDVKTEGTVKIEGEVLGNVIAAQQVLLARGSRVKGDVQTREAVIGGLVEGAAFYAYAAPVPAGLEKLPVEPPAAYYHRELGEYLLPYNAMRTSPDPDRALRAFIDSTYEQAAKAANWNRAALERLAAPAS